MNRLVVTESLVLTPEAMTALVKVCRAGAPDEVCGFVLGRDDGIGTEVHQMANVHHNPRSNYRMSDADVLTFYRQLDTLRPGLDVLAVFHSHPTNEPNLSLTDLDEARDLTIPYLIVSLQGNKPRARAWRINLAAIGVKTTDPVTIVVQEPLELPEAPTGWWPFTPGNRVAIRYRRQNEAEPRDTIATVVELDEQVEVVRLKPDPGQASKPSSIALDRIQEVRILSEVSASYVARGVLTVYAEHLVEILAGQKATIGTAGPLIGALAKAWPQGVKISYAAEVRR